MHLLRWFDKASSISGMLIRRWNWISAPMTDNTTPARPMAAAAAIFSSLPLPSIIPKVRTISREQRFSHLNREKKKKFKKRRKI